MFYCMCPIIRSNFECVTVESSQTKSRCGVWMSLKDALRDSFKGEKCLCRPVTLLTVLRVCVCPYAQCLHRCMDNSECPDKNRLPGDMSPAGAHCSGPRIGQESHSSTSYHALHSLFPKALATSSLNLTCLWPLSCSKTRRDALAFFFFFF